MAHKAKMDKTNVAETPKKGEDEVECVSTAQIQNRSVEDFKKVNTIFEIIC